ncbi:divergent protein kinase domain 1C [Ixodes scapularis]
MKVIQCAFVPRRYAKAVKLFTGLACLALLFGLAQYSLSGCSRHDVEAFLSYLCNSYKRGEISGDLCPHLCSENFSNIQCQGQHLGKEVVFSATWNSERIVLKAKKRHLDSLEPVYWTDSQRRRHYPDDKAFAHMANAQFRFALRRNGSWVKGFFGSHLTNAQMDSVYGLLQQTEYLFSLALRNHHAVASLLGTCGHAYAVEFLSPLETHGQRSGTFKQRAGIGLRILRTLETLESAMDEHIHQCDMKPNHFGIDKRGNVKMLDLDALGLQSAVQANIANTGHCESDRDCDFFDCAGRCNDQGLCDAVVLNDNLQRVCKNIFLGKIFGRFSGLLRGPPSHIASDISVVLNDCISSTRGSVANNESYAIHKRLVQLLQKALVP